ncbi:glycoside hydrolase family 10 protein [Pedobacter glucosidilyticus]|uniref:glycoside hydrolase family 10 protein n=1 Tax=Pedobacter glucosidilyticus TaxID=1122941 RepID=UPI0026EA31FD|nr:family 10 glycosylhydrolase [Pedobacter glucosidilyticus]
MRKKVWVLLLITIALHANGQVKQIEAVRGVWVPAPRFTKVLHSYENVQKFVGLLDSLNFNAVFLVSYAQTQSIYPSKVIKEYTGSKNLAATSMLSPYLSQYHQPLKSPTGDPVADLIRLAHQRHIKVFFWYEYGFMGDTKPITDKNPLLAKNPDWLGIGNDGKPAAYHQKDFYFNAYHPKVQDYMIKLIEEGIKLYPEVDGVQGDDRLPAMPRNSGYDAYTIAKYKAEHQGNLPPQDFNEKSWVNWRIAILNQFGKRLYKAAHALKKDIMVSFAPNPYPWSKENLMQDWPNWVKEGICDLLAVQCYRYSADAYKNTVSEALSYVNSNRPKQLFAPGIILMEGNQIKMSADLLKQQLKINRDLNINGEIFFYNEALNNKEIQSVFKEVYPYKAKFPDDHHR